MRIANDENRGKQGELALGVYAYSGQLVSPRLEAIAGLYGTGLYDDICGLEMMSNDANSTLGNKEKVYGLSQRGNSVRHWTARRFGIHNGTIEGRSPVNSGKQHSYVYYIDASAKELCKECTRPARGGHILGSMPLLIGNEGPWI